MKTKEELRNFVLSENAFTVLSEFRRLGLLSKEEINNCMSMSREEWVDAMFKAAGIAEDDE